jgi:hypothetical protein
MSIDIIGLILLAAGALALDWYVNWREKKP